MPYNPQLADRVRSALSDRDHVREVKMFGGLALMVDDRMVVCVSGGGSDLLVRVAPERDAELVTKPGAHRAEMGRDRSMGEGWITVDERALESDDDLQYWIDVSLDFHARGPGQKTRKSARKK
ncbi:MAG: TfoX/Sxy family protein [Actinomycetia bacterium]|nr:TfoX/Sxy family protein [Actinomycetes bacterium]